MQHILQILRCSTILYVHLYTFIHAVIYINSHSKDPVINQSFSRKFNNHSHGNSTKGFGCREAEIRVGSHLAMDGSSSGQSRSGALGNRDISNSESMGLVYEQLHGFFVDFDGKCR